MVMMLHTGVPGSGKTYLMVQKMIEAYFDWDKETESYVRKEKYKDLVIISNIESLTVEHKDLEGMMDTRCRVLAENKAHKENVGDLVKDSVIEEYYWDFYAERVRWFFDYEYQKRLTSTFGGGIIYCMEEVQDYFDTKRFARAKWARDVCYYFEKHRHMGHSIYMDTQHNSKIASDIRVLFETEIAAAPRTMSITGEFRYNELVSGTKVNQMPIVCRPKKRIFACYKSMAHDETVKTKKPVLKLVAFVVFIGFVAFGVYLYSLDNLGGGVASVPAPSAAPGVAAASAPGVAALAPPAGAWLRVPWVKVGEEKSFYNPVDMVLQKSEFFPYRIRRSGGDYFAFIPDDFSSLKKPLGKSMFN